MPQTPANVDNDLLAGQLDALMSQLESQPALSNSARASVKADPAIERAVASAMSAPPPAAPDPIAAAEQASTAADDLASQLEQLLSQPTPPPPTKPKASPVKPASNVDALSAQLDSLLTRTADQLEASVTPAPPAAAREAPPPVNVPARSAAPVAQTNPEPAISRDDEAELVGQLDTLLAQQAGDELATEADYASTDDLASMLGISEEELEQVPHSDNAPPPAGSLPPAAMPDPDEVDVLGMFLSPKQVGEFEADPATFLAEHPEFQEPAAAPEDDAWYEPPVHAKADSAPIELPAQTARPARAIEPAAASVADTPAIQAVSAPTPAPAPVNQPKPAAEQPSLRTHVHQLMLALIQLTRTLVVRLWPLLREALKHSPWLFKAMCYAVSWPVDWLAGKLLKPERPAPPIKSYVGYAALPLLAGGLLLMISVMLGG